MNFIRDPTTKLAGRSLEKLRKETFKFLRNPDMRETLMSHPGNVKVKTIFEKFFGPEWNEERKAPDMWLGSPREPVRSNKVSDEDAEDSKDDFIE